jgi:hypothetical protein
MILQDALLKNYGKVQVTLSSANSISHDKIQASLATYIREMSSTVSNSHGNETFYLFGPVAEISPRLRSLVATYVPPPFASDKAAISFGIGAAGSGVPFHVHGHGYSEVIHGAKVCHSLVPVCSLFGPKIPPRLRGPLEAYKQPLFVSGKAVICFGIGSGGSGGPFRVHGRGYSEAVETLTDRCSDTYTLGR